MKILLGTWQAYAQKPNPMEFVALFLRLLGNLLLPLRRKFIDGPKKCDWEEEIDVVRADNRVFRVFSTEEIDEHFTVISERD